MNNALVKLAEDRARSVCAADALGILISRWCIPLLTRGECVVVRNELAGTGLSTFLHDTTNRFNDVAMRQGLRQRVLTADAPHATTSRDLIVHLLSCLGSPPSARLLARTSTERMARLFVDRAQRESITVVILDQLNNLPAHEFLWFAEWMSLQGVFGVARERSQIGLALVRNVSSPRWGGRRVPRNATLGATPDSIVRARVDQSRIFAEITLF